MNESGPQAKRPDVFKDLFRRAHPDVLPREHLSAAEMITANNTYTAFTFLKDFYQEYRQIPSEWASLGYNHQTEASAGLTSETQFTFAKVVNGEVIIDTNSYPNPGTFFKALKDFYSLETPASKEEQRAAEMRALRIARENANAASAPIVTPDRPITPLKPPSPFRPRN